MRCVTCPKQPNKPMEVYNGHNTNDQILHARDTFRIMWHNIYETYVASSCWFSFKLQQRVVTCHALSMQMRRFYNRSLMRHLDTTPSWNLHLFVKSERVPDTAFSIKKRGLTTSRETFKTFSRWRQDWSHFSRNWMVSLLAQYEHHTMNWADGRVTNSCFEYQPPPLSISYHHRHQDWLSDLFCDTSNIARYNNRVKCFIDSCWAELMEHFTMLFYHSLLLIWFYLIWF